MLVSSDTTHPSGSIPPINLAQVLRLAGHHPTLGVLKVDSCRGVANDARQNLVHILSSKTPSAERDHAPASPTRNQLVQQLVAESGRRKAKSGAAGAKRGFIGQMQRTRRNWYRFRMRPGCVRMRPDASGCVRMRPDASGMRP